MMHRLSSRISLLNTVRQSRADIRSSHERLRHADCSRKFAKRAKAQLRSKMDGCRPRRQAPCGTLCRILQPVRLLVTRPSQLPWFTGIRSRTMSAHEGAENQRQVVTGTRKVVTRRSESTGRAAPLPWLRLITMSKQRTHCLEKEEWVAVKDPALSLRLHQGYASNLRQFREKKCTYPIHTCNLHACAPSFHFCTQAPVHCVRRCAGNSGDAEEGAERKDYRARKVLRIVGKAMLHA
ncbi:hypothetical protein K437DRAFT_43729 [Tilletiaria anomala UBC 951]|uniref:Uncharacterized protein n=1 Tax=Tilletiaria anomala (strain ATCC 24038 / CBS 436.72 / UBC 951) TaxID=1037660 RepID=A0A066V6P4_TILAU|nr:uncharacterized protein K437DRAFT_43729 [Tilletiaria anomala UBC 951]KDN37156.1 hypothetical protein K437DRAFT_43729 [Tilletiaria anomala UBC 951]